MSESQVFHGRLSSVDIQEHKKLHAEAKAQHDTSRAPPTFALPPLSYGGVQSGPTVPSQPHPHPPQLHHRYPPSHPAAMQNTGDEHHHRHYPTVHPRHTVVEKQQLVDQVPDWLKTDIVVWVKIPGLHHPITGMVKFVGSLQVRGVAQLTAGVQLVSCKLDNTFMQHAIKLAAFTVHVFVTNF